MLSFIAFTAFSQEKLDSTILESHNGTNLEAYNKNVFDYDANNNLLSDSAFDMQMSAWTYYSVTNNLFDASNNLTSRIEETDSKTEYVYNALGNVTVIYMYQWNTTWDEFLKIDVSYTSFDKPDFFIAYFWNTTTSLWDIPYIKDVFSYNSSDNLTSIARQEWDAVSTSFVTNENNVYT